MPEVTDIPFLMRKYCIIKKKGKSQTGHCADFIQAFLVLSVCNTRDTDLWRNIMHNLTRSCHPVNLCLVFMYTRDVKLSFPNNNIKQFTLWIVTLYVSFDQFSLDWPIYTYIWIERQTCLPVLILRRAFQNAESVSYCCFVRWFLSVCFLITQKGLPVSCQIL